mmetsp:Transcript_38485/g.107245  ORF Transcript_38485/g.107245 Transcript_38485/m.107245 type:complete len:228 (-) Transcript_38485:663-1346(-)
MARRPHSERRGGGDGGGRAADAAHHARCWGVCHVVARPWRPHGAGDAELRAHHHALPRACLARQSPTDVTRHLPRRRAPGQAGSRGACRYRGDLGHPARARAAHGGRLARQRCMLRQGRGRAHCAPRHGPSARRGWGYPGCGRVCGEPRRPRTPALGALHSGLTDLRPGVARKALRARARHRSMRRRRRRRCDCAAWSAASGSERSMPGERQHAPYLRSGRLPPGSS